MFLTKLLPELASNYFIQSASSQHLRGYAVVRISSFLSGVGWVEVLGGESLTAVTALPGLDGNYFPGYLLD